MFSSVHELFLEFVVGTVEILLSFPRTCMCP